jgi:NCS1 family nucleobase:cation symporter-1
MIKEDIHELNSIEEIKNEPGFNEDLAPTTLKQRTWNKWHIASLWVGMSICIPTYTLGGILTAYFGLSVMEALFTIFIANVVVLIPLCLNAIPGTKYGIPFPVLLRSSFGIKGSNIPALVRAVVACGWFGIQTMFGGLAIDILFDNLIPGWENLGGYGQVIGFFIFWTLNIYVVLKGSESIKILETVSAPLLLIVSAVLLYWGSSVADLGQVFGAPANRPEDAGFFGYFFAALTAMVGFWATLALNIPDFSRFAESQKAQIHGQIIGLPVTMFLFSALGVIMTGASVSIFGEAIADPVTLIGKLESGFVVVILMIMIILATISTNTAANIVSPTNDFQNISAKLIDRRRGVLMTGLVGILLMAWDLMRVAGIVSGDGLEGRYANWLLGYSSLLGPVAGIMIADFFIVKKQELEVTSLYKSQGVHSGYNLNGIIAWGVPVILAILGTFQDQGNLLRGLYDYGWFTGFLIGAVIYVILNRVNK